MKQTFASMITLWALVGAPNLCRAGVLVGCCQHAPERDMAPVAAVGWCNEGEPKNLPENRECGSCANVCNTIAKPPDGGDQAAMEFPAAAIVSVVSVSVETLALRDPAPRIDLSVSRIDLPFPPSDVPLLI